MLFWVQKGLFLFLWEQTCVCKDRWVDCARLAWRCAVLVEPRASVQNGRSGNSSWPILVVLASHCKISIKHLLVKPKRKTIEHKGHFAAMARVKSKWTFTSTHCIVPRLAIVPGKFRILKCVTKVVTVVELCHRKGLQLVDPFLPCFERKSRNSSASALAGSRGRPFRMNSPPIPAAQFAVSLALVCRIHR